MAVVSSSSDMAQSNPPNLFGLNVPKNSTQSITAFFARLPYSELLAFL